MKDRFLASLSFAMLGCSAAPAWAASSLQPPQPSSFDLVNLRMTVDDCAFNPSTVRVTLVANAFIVRHRPNPCLVAGNPVVVDVRLGSVPAGNYRVDVIASLDSAAPPAESIIFTVLDRPEIAIFPPPPRPLTDYSGIWFSVLESGWGVSFHQGADNMTFAMLFVYGATGQPDWYSIQGGRWVNSTTWTGTAYHTTGPSLASSVFDPMLVIYGASGGATFDFSQAPGHEGEARFSYVIGNVTATKTLKRMPL
jgi:hypothetical protein